MKTVVALEDLKINAMYKVEGKKEPFLKKILIKKGSIFSLYVNSENFTKYSIQGETEYTITNITEEVVTLNNEKEVKTSTLLKNYKF